MPEPARRVSRSRITVAASSARVLSIRLSGELAARLGAASGRIGFAGFEQAVLRLCRARRNDTAVIATFLIQRRYRFNLRCGVVPGGRVAPPADRMTLRHSWQHDVLLVDLSPLRTTGESK